MKQMPASSTNLCSQTFPSMLDKAIVTLKISNRSKDKSLSNRVELMVGHEISYFRNYNKYHETTLFLLVFLTS